MRWALIKKQIDNTYKCVNVIEALQPFIDSIKSQYDYVVQEPLELDAGSVGDLYDPNTDTFTRVVSQVD